MLKRNFLKEQMMGVNGLKQKEGRFVVDIGEKFLSLGVVRHRNMLHREAVDAPYLEVIKDRLGEALNSLVCERCPCPWQQGWN